MEAKDNIFSRVLSVKREVAEKNSINYTAIFKAIDNLADMAIKIANGLSDVDVEAVISASPNSNRLIFALDMSSHGITSAWLGSDTHVRHVLRDADFSACSKVIEAFVVSTGKIGRLIPYKINVDLMEPKVEISLECDAQPYKFVEVLRVNNYDASADRVSSDPTSYGVTIAVPMPVVAAEK